LRRLYRYKSGRNAPVIKSPAALSTTFLPCRAQSSPVHRASVRKTPLRLPPRHIQDPCRPQLLSASLPLSATFRRHRNIFPYLPDRGSSDEMNSRSDCNPYILPESVQRHGSALL